MLTNIEKAIIRVLQTLELKRDTIMAIMLLLTDNPAGQISFMEFLKQSNPNYLNEKVIMNKVKELMVD